MWSSLRGFEWSNVSKKSQYLHKLHPPPTPTHRCCLLFASLDHPSSSGSGTGGLLPPFRLSATPSVRPLYPSPPSAAHAIPQGTGRGQFCTATQGGPAGFCRRATDTGFVPLACRRLDEGEAPAESTCHRAARRCVWGTSLPWCGSFRPPWWDWGVEEGPLRHARFQSLPMDHKLVVRLKKNSQSPTETKCHFEGVLQYIIC